MSVIVTNKGRELFAIAHANTTVINITEIAVGTLSDIEYNDDNLHTGAETALHDEKHRTTINRAYVDQEDSLQVIFEAIIAPQTGGFSIREVGLFDDSGNLIAIAKHPDTYVPETASSGVIVDDVVQMVLKIESTENVNVTYNLSAALATQQWTAEMILGQAAAGYLKTLKNSEEIGQIKGHIFL